MLLVEKHVVWLWHYKYTIYMAECWLEIAQTWTNLFQLASTLCGKSDCLTQKYFADAPSLSRVITILRLPLMVSGQILSSVHSDFKPGQWSVIRFY